AAGNKYLDFYGGHCVCCLGHSPREVADAIAAQAKELLFYSNLAPMPVREKAADKLIQFAANGFTKVFFCNSGGEANENALKIAIKATGRQKIAAFKGAFHGRTLLALGATDNAKWHGQYAGWVGEVERFEPNTAESLAQIDGQTAAVILEPIQSIGGCTVFEPDYLRALKEACDKHGALLIYDEVQTGMGRTGSPFVSGHWAVLPHMATLAKGLAGGFPIGAVMMTREVADSISPGDIAATFGGGPLAMAAMGATVCCLKKYNLVGHAAEIEHYVRRKFTVSQVTEIRGKGCLLGLVLDREAKPVQQALFKKGIITGLNSNPHLLHLLPPLTIQFEHVDLLHQALIEVLKAA
ncbi:MAG TPA: aminotransferase class III-fold pyridoxal phosphate-dependent enzyme, partial [Oligoflexia bacterium]|nr:aminotransferase class III-fold pyridoxal phosphate-dependent enzyme [Oligoflexia bacterium]